MPIKMINLAHPFISENATIEVFEAPYRHIVIKNLFTPVVYSSLCRGFNGYIERVQRPHGAVGGTGQFYDARIYTMKEGDCVGGYDFFVWEGWKAFIAECFSLVLNNYTAYTLHYHAGSPESPSKSGWSHLDLSVCSAVHSNKTVQLTGGCEYADDTFSDQPFTQKILRSVALLYYFNNPDGISDIDGGGTAVLGSYDSNDIIKTIFPYNNSLFAFEVGVKSYHAFVGARYNRSAMVQWFHSNPSYIVNKNLHLFKERWRMYGDLFERWKKHNPWTIDRDPEYLNYFNCPLGVAMA